MEILKIHKKKIISVFLLVCLAVICIVSYIAYSVPSTVYAEDQNCVCECESEVASEFYVDIKGAVKNPGVYLVSENNIIKDVIEMAGGLKSNATTSNLNLSKKVTNEMVITVLTKSELASLSTTTSTTTQAVSTTCTTKIISDCDTSSLTSETLVNINTASKEELMSVPNIGASKADSIIIYRAENKFNKIEDIMNVSGIGETLYAKIKDYITV